MIPNTRKTSQPAKLRHAGIAALLLTSIAFSGGIYTHLRAGYYAAEHVSFYSGTLENVLEGEQFGMYGAGLLFPDSFQLLCSLNCLDEDPANHYPVNIQDGHEAEFLNTYLSQLVGTCGPGLGIPELMACRELTAHFMGSLAHVITDQRFDRYFLRRVDTSFGFDDSGSPDGSQGFTDGVLDAVFACDPNLVDVHGIALGSVPGPYQAQGVCEGNPACLNALEVIHAAYPDTNAVPFGWPWLAAAINAHIAGVAAIHLDCNTSTPTHLVLEAIFNSRQAMNPDWDLRLNYEDNYGGLIDCGEIVAQYIGKTWEILNTSGYSDPMYADFGTGAYGQRFLIREPGGRYWDFASWIKLPETDFDVTQFQMVRGDGVNDFTFFIKDQDLYRYQEPWDKFVEADLVCENVLDFEVTRGVTSMYDTTHRVAVLLAGGSTAEGDSLWVWEGAANGELDAGTWTHLAEGVSDFELLGLTRIAALVQVGGVSPAQRLLVKEGPIDSEWVVVLKDEISQFQLQQDPSGVPRIGALRTGSACADQELLIMEGALDSPWLTFDVDGINDFQMGQARVWALADGELWSRDWAQSSSTHRLSSVTDLQVDYVTGHVGALDSAGQLFVWRGSANVDMEQLPGGLITSFQLSGQALMVNDNLYRILGGDGTFLDTEPEGLPEYQPAPRVHHSGGDYPRMGVLIDDTLYVKRLP